MTDDDGDAGHRPAATKAHDAPPGRLGLWILIGVVALVGTFLLLRTSADGPAAQAPAVEVTEVPVAGRDHVQGDVEYPTTPAAGGPHAPTWQNCGFYNEPVMEELAVHSLEHGAVWLTYDPGLDTKSLEALRSLAGGHVLVSPVDDQPAPVIATAWGVQLHLDSATDPALDAFLRSYVQGPQTPERGAVCSGAVGSPT